MFTLNKLIGELEEEDLTVCKDLVEEEEEVIGAGKDDVKSKNNNDEINDEIITKINKMYETLGACYIQSIDCECVYCGLSSHISSLTNNIECVACNQQLPGPSKMIADQQSYTLQSYLKQIINILSTAHSNIPSVIISLILEYADLVFSTNSDTESHQHYHFYYALFYNRPTYKWLPIKILSNDIDKKHIQITMIHNKKSMLISYDDNNNSSRHDQIYIFRNVYFFNYTESLRHIKDTTFIEDTNGITFNIKTLVGRRYSVTARWDRTVSYLEKFMFWKCGIPIQQQRYLAPSRSISDWSHPLSYFGVVEGCDVKLILRLRGGGIF